MNTEAEKDLLNPSQFQNTSDAKDSERRPKRTSTSSQGSAASLRSKSSPQWNSRIRTLRTTQEAQTKAILSREIIVGPNPVKLQPCPYCQEHTITRIEQRCTVYTHLWAAMFCFVCLSPCIPYCLRGFKNPTHFCVNCNAYIGTCVD